MDFIIRLPPTVYRRKAYDALLVIVDRFSKMVKYITCLKEIDAPDMADRLIKKIFSCFSKLRSIVSDKGSTFTSKY
jgi:hypothetical protein